MAKETKLPRAPDPTLPLNSRISDKIKGDMLAFKARTKLSLRQIIEQSFLAYKASYKPKK